MDTKTYYAVLSIAENLAENLQKLSTYAEKAVDLFEIYVDGKVKIPDWYLDKYGSK